KKKDVRPRLFLSDAIASSPSSGSRRPGTAGGSRTTTSLRPLRTHRESLRRNIGFSNLLDVHCRYSQRKHCM
ncbi:unnamed protein product, partial [Musa hybrid cultivar]